MPNNSTGAPVGSSSTSSIDPSEKRTLSLVRLNGDRYDISVDPHSTRSIGDLLELLSEREDLRKPPTSFLALLRVELIVESDLIEETEVAAEELLCFENRWFVEENEDQVLQEEDALGRIPEGGSSSSRAILAVREEAPQSSFGERSATAPLSARTSSTDSVLVDAKPTVESSPRVLFQCYRLMIRPPRTPSGDFDVSSFRDGNEARWWVEYGLYRKHEKFIESEHAFFLW